jgi:hypothetical protein
MPVPSDGFLRCLCVGGRLLHLCEGIADVLDRAEDVLFRVRWAGRRGRLGLALQLEPIDDRELAP